jgi:hypothetical protein
MEKPPEKNSLAFTSNYTVYRQEIWCIKMSNIVLKTHLQASITLKIFRGLYPQAGGGDPLLRLPHTPTA